MNWLGLANEHVFVKLKTGQSWEHYRRTIITIEGDRYYYIVDSASSHCAWSMKHWRKKKRLTIPRSSIQMHKLCFFDFMHRETHPSKLVCYLLIHSSPCVLCILCSQCSWECLSQYFDIRSLSHLYTLCKQYWLAEMFTQKVDIMIMISIRLF